MSPYDSFTAGNNSLRDAYFFGFGHTLYGFSHGDWLDRRYHAQNRAYENWLGERRIPIHIGSGTLQPNFRNPILRYSQQAPGGSFDGLRGQGRDALDIASDASIAAQQGAVRYGNHIVRTILHLPQGIIDFGGATVGRIVNVIDPGTRGVTVDAAIANIIELGDLDQWIATGRYYSSPEGIAEIVVVTNLGILTAGSSSVSSTGAGTIRGGVTRGGIQILEQEGNVIVASIRVARGEARVITEVVREGNTLILRGTHIEGQGTLREALRAAAEYGQQQGATRVIIEGGRRTTGANPGHIPRPIIINLDG